MADLGAPQTPAQPSGTGKEAYTWGMLCHLSALAGLIGIPLGTVIGPLIFWLLKKNEYPFVDAQGKAALNFQISVIIYAIVCFVLVFVVIGIPLLILLAIFDLIMVIMASIKASNGESFKYPLAIRFIS